MKKLFTLLATLLVTATLWAQSPAKMSYQAVIRNSSNALVTNTPVGMKISILQGSASGTAVYSEIQTPTTNTNGLISIEIGGAGFDAIDWLTGPFFIMTETDPTGGTDYTITGTSQLLSVPYALHSKTAESISGGITETDPVFVTSPANAISTGNIANWNTAYGWGNHAIEGYLKNYTETDPVWNAASANYYTKTNMQTSGASQLHFNNITNKPTSITGYGILDAMTTTHVAYGITSANIINWNTAYGWGNHATEGYIKSYTETDPVWNAASANYYTKTNLQTSGASQLHFNNLTNKPTSVAGYGILDAMTTTHVAYGITSANIINWNTAYGWGNHATAGYIKSYTETDPIWSAASANYYTKTNLQTSGASQLHFNNITNKPTSVAGYGILDAMTTAHATYGITSANITNWNTAYGWGNHAGLYRPISYVPAWSEITSNPFVFTSVANNQLVKYNSTSGKWENWTANYLTSFTETDPVFGASPAKAITTPEIASWNTAYSWGNHASAGYLTNEVDGSITNEIQSLSISNDSVYLSDGGVIKLPPSNAWSLKGNSGTVDGTNFIGTTDNIPFIIKVNNQKSGRINQNGTTFFGYQAGNADNGISNTGFGYQALYSNTTGPSNSAFGAGSLQHNTLGGWNVASGSQSLQSNTTGGWNNANGTQSMISNTSGNWNNANGTAALSSNTTGNNNTASGSNSLGNNKAGNNGVAVGYGSQQYANNTTTAYDNTNTSVGYQSLMGSSNPSANMGINNTAIGREALFSNSSGYNNTANGFQALFSNVTGYRNTADGYRALYSNISGNNNTASGPYSLYYNTTGYQNSANGSGAIYANTTGYQNTASGNGALYSNFTGNGNTVSGVTALFTNESGNYNTAIGMEAGFLNISGSSNVFLGYRAGYNETGSDKLYIANNSTNPPLIYGDFASGNVGIGTTAPGSKLDVQGMINASGGFCIGGNCITSWPKSSPWVSSGTDINYGMGNVGIGTASPLAKLQVNGEAIIDNLTGRSILTLASTSGATPFLTFGGTSGGIIQTAQNTLSMRFGSGGTASSVDFEPANVTFRTGGFTGYERLTINSVGNVGIGTTTPAAKLDVNGDVIVRGNFYASGTVVQTIVKTSEVTSSLNVTSFTEADPDYRISITPKYANSIILVEYNFSINTAMTATTVFHMQLVKDIGVSDELVGTGPINGLRNRTSFVSRPSNGQDANDLQNVYMVAKDNGLTAGTTYTYGFKYRREPGGSGSCYFNASYGDADTYGFSGVMTMKATEIAQ